MGGGDYRDGLWHPQKTYTRLRRGRVGTTRMGFATAQFWDWRTEVGNLDLDGRMEMGDWIFLRLEDGDWRLGLYPLGFPPRPILPSGHFILLVI